MINTGCRDYFGDALQVAGSSKIDARDTWDGGNFANDPGIKLDALVGRLR
jgi:hypothetical protein